ncbi:gluconolaconase [Flavobacterium sp. DGU11]|uniref:Gluconolaconase n=1 Tax=Flavobacterium arundinis TaxID=3139143 RepID=A0ABU9HUW4_9FLAO
MKNYIAGIILAYSAIAVAQDKPTARIEFEAPGAYPEGIAYDKASNVFYVSSARLGTIGKVDRSGKYTALYTDAALKSTYGLKVHPDGKRLFACVGDANYSIYSTPDTKKKMARLISIDLKTGKKLADTDLSKLVPGEHFPNDLTFDDKGNAYITDSFAHAIYKVDASGKASVFSKSDLFKTAGVGLNGIVWHPGGFLLATGNGQGCLFKVDINNPGNVTKVKIDQFFPGADGMLLNDANTLTLVQNGGVDKIFRIKSTDNWVTAKPAEATLAGDRFKYPSTAAIAGNETWIMNANFSELGEGNNVPSKKFDIQMAVFRPVK